MKTHGAARGLSRFEGFTDAVFVIILTLLIVEIKVPREDEEYASEVGGRRDLPRERQLVSGEEDVLMS